MMESSEKTDTPRRSMRLQRQRAVTPDLQILGPRELMKFNKSRQKIEFDQSSSSRNLPEINIIPSTPVSTKKRRHTHSSTNSKKSKADDIKKNENIVETDVNKNTEVRQAPGKDEIKTDIKKTEINLKAQDPVEDKNKTVDAKTTENTVEASVEKYIEVVQDPVESEKNTFNVKQTENTIEADIKTSEACQDPVKDGNKVADSQIETKNDQEQVLQSPTENEEYHSAINENIEGNTCEKTLEAANNDKNDSNNKDKKEVEQKVEDEDKKLNITPQLMDESIISVPESPSMISTAAIKDSTFSPEVDTSIRDTRPHIDNVMTPVLPRNITLRTSTPLSRVLKRDTPKLSDPVISALKKVLSPKVGENKKLNEESLNETFNSQFKMGNPLEKSILKSSRRKRSLSVADGESFMQKKVDFMSPQIMNIDVIDEKMLQSFMDEKETSKIQQALASGGGMHRKRSLSETGTPGKPKIKVPNFKAIHEQQFKRMESIVDHAQRKAERAKRLATPSKGSSLPKIKETVEHNAASKIPTRKPLTKVPSTENILHGIKSRTIKRSNSAETYQRPPTSSKIPNLKESGNKFGSGKKTLRRILDSAKTASPKLIATKVQPVSKFTATKKPTVSTSIPKASSSVQSMRAKVEERRERNMSLYKGNSTKNGLDHRKKTENALKGVRLNRRFELQMQHRRMEENED